MSEKKEKGIKGQVGREDRVVWTEVRARRRHLLKKRSRVES